MTSFDYEVLEDARYIPLLVIGCISSSLSIMGSACVLYIALRDLRQKILHRLIFGLSLADLVSSTALLFMPFSVPSYIGLAGAVGTHATCTMTGFFFQMNMQVGCCYNAYLSIYYLLLVRRNWREQDFKRWLESVAHTFAVMIPFGLAFISAITQSTNPNILINNICIPTVYPWGCGLDDNVECQRSSVEVVRTIAAATVIFVGIFSITGFVCTGLVCYTVQSTLQRSSMHRFEGGMDRSASDRMRQVQTQASLYSLVYFNTLLWPLFGNIFQEAKGLQANTVKLEPGYYVLALLFWTFFPLQGFLNFFVFTRLKANQWRKVEPERSIFWIYKQILGSTEVPTTSSVANTTTASRLSATLHHPNRVSARLSSRLMGGAAELSESAPEG